MNLTARDPDEREFAFSDKEFKFLAGLANRHTGIVLADHKKDMVYSRLVRRIRALGLKSFAEYCELMQSDGAQEEMVNLVNAITTNLTSFFREMHHFEHLHDAVLAPLVSSGARRVRIWSAGCSAGMEPYSIAMTMRSAIPNLGEWDARILATDIDTNMLNTGAAGEYAPEQQDNIPAAYRSHVSRNSRNNRIQMSDELRQMIAFKPLNLLESWPMKGPFDAVFCRNVVIYFDKPTQSRLFSRMADMLRPDGWLYIGHSENLFNVCDRFDLVGRTIYRRIR